MTKHLTTKDSGAEDNGNGHSIANEKISLELLMSDWNAEQEQVKRAIEYNRNAGVKNPEAWIGYGFAPGTTEPADVKRRIRWWNAITNKRTGKPNTLEALQNAGVVRDDEIALFGDNPTFPKRELSQLHRVRKQDGSEWLTRHESWTGISAIGGVVSIPVILGFYHRVPITPTTAKIEDGNEVKVLQIGTTENAYYSLQKIYTTKFTKQNVLDALKIAPPITENGVPVNVSYNLKREGHTRTMVVSTSEEFTDEGNFMEIWEQSLKPAPTISIDHKTFSNYVKMDRESRTEHKQYS